MKLILFLVITALSHGAIAQNRCADLFSLSESKQQALIDTKELESPLSLDFFQEMAARDPYFAQQQRLIESQLTKDGRLPAPTDISKANENFRKSLLPALLVSPQHREAVVRYMEAELKFKSEATKRKLAIQAESYDVVILGGGVHGTIALQTLMRQNPNLKVLVIEETDAIGATFRYPNESFNINSSNRPSAEDSLPLPGRGNINELPQLPIQVSDLTAVKYPSAGDLATALTSGFYAAVQLSPKIDVLFTTSLKNIDAKAFLDKGSNYTLLGGYTAKNKIDFKVSAQRIILATGLGTPRIPASVRESLTKSMVRSPNVFKQLPKVMTFEDIMRVLGQSNNPRALLSGKTIAVVGVGDSANVFIEFVLGYASRRGYNLSTAQVPPPQKILWLGQERRTCDEFIADARSRYNQIGSGYKSSDPNTEALIEAVPQRLKAISEVRNGLKLDLEDSRKKVDADLVILATGFEGELYKLFGDLPGLAQKPAPKTDEELFENYFSPLKAVTATTGDRPSNVAQESLLFIGGRSVKNESGVIVVGPGAGELPKKRELFGIIQNFVSIFNNSLRTEAATKALAAGVKAVNATVPGPRLQVNEGRRRIYIKGVQQSFSLAEANQVYLESVLLRALKQADFAGKEDLSLSFALQRDGISITSNYKVEEVIALLAKTRDFFNTLSSVLLKNEKKATAWSLKAPVKKSQADTKSAVFEFKTAPEGSAPESALEIFNEPLPLAPVKLGE